MHDLLFDTNTQWAVENLDPALIALADQLYLDQAVFSPCLNNRQALESVLNDLYDAQGVFNRPPNFVILFDGRGRVMSSSRPADEFVVTLQDIVDSANAAGALEP